MINNNKAEAEPPPTFRWLDAENQPVTEGQVVNDQYKVFIDDNNDDFDDDGDDVKIIHQMNMITLIMILMSTIIWLMRGRLSMTNTIKMMIAIKITRTITLTITIHEEKAESKVVDTYVL